jgi:hypothetical protein
MGSSYVAVPTKHRCAAATATRDRCWHRRVAGRGSQSGRSFASNRALTICATTTTSLGTVVTISLISSAARASIPVRQCASGSPHRGRSSSASHKIIGHHPLAHRCGDAYIAARLGANYGGRLRTRMNMLANQCGERTQCERPVTEPVTRPRTACAESD